MRVPVFPICRYWPCARFLLALIFVFLSVTRGDASQTFKDPSAICENAAILVSRESGVPLDVLRAIALTETGRKGSNGFLPWPWTVNMEGKGKWFDSVSSALAYVESHFARGARSFDVGCFQINYRWHGQSFASIEEMFEPLANARYAAKFLKDLFAEFGSWTKAAGAYHSRTPKYAKRYKARFQRIRSELKPIEYSNVEAVNHDAPINPLPRPVVQRVNRYPLLQSGLSNSVGSLVPRSTQRGTRFLELTHSPSLLGSR